MLAATLPITSLNALKPYKVNWRIQVKVLHIWKQYSTKIGETIEMFLVDISVSYNDVRNGKQNKTYLFG